MNSTKVRKNEYWYPEDVRPYIIEYLKKLFPDSIIRQESNMTDIVVLTRTRSIPIEIQRVYNCGNSISVSGFEDNIRRQIEQNVEISDQCWLFLDDKFIKYLKNISNTMISFNMKWLYEYYNENRVKLFSIDHNGLIKELGNEELNILTKFHITRLDKNRYNIEYNLLKWKCFTTEEINNIYSSFKKNDIGYASLHNWLLRNDSSNREKEYGHICHSLGQLYNINDILNCSIPGDDSTRKRIANCRRIGLFNMINGQKSGSTTYFTDDAKISGYFDGYENNKELWDYIRYHPVDNRTLYNIVTGDYPNYLRDRSGQSDLSMFY